VVGFGGDRTEHDRDDSPAGGDIDRGQLVDLADSFEVPDEKAVLGDQVAGRAGPVAEPER
jgi:hypothetical protein